MEQMSRIRKLMDTYSCFEETDAGEEEMPLGILCYQQIVFKYFSRLDSTFDPEGQLYSENLLDTEKEWCRYFAARHMNSCAEGWLEHHSNYFIQDTSLVWKDNNIIDEDKIYSIFGGRLGKKLLFHASEWMCSPTYYGCSNALYFIKVEPLVMRYMEQPMLFHLTDEERLTADIIIKRLKKGGYFTSRFSEWTNSFFLSEQKEAAIFIFATREYLDAEFEYGWLDLIMLDIGFILGYQWLCERLEKEVMKGEYKTKRTSSVAACRKNA